MRWAQHSCRATCSRDNVKNYLSSCILALALPLAACSSGTTGGGGSFVDDSGDSGVGGLFFDGSSVADSGKLSDSKADGIAIGKVDALSDGLGDTLKVDTALDIAPDTSKDGNSEVSAADGTSCSSDSQCPGADPCKVGLCEKGSCVLTPLYGCCETGPCCDALTHLAKAEGSACDGPSLAIEYGCQGQDMLMRSQVAGCDGVAFDSCSSGSAVWGAWQKTGACPADGVCVLLSAKQKPQCSSGGPPQCTSDAGCDDGDPCTKNPCVGFVCQKPVVVVGAVCASTASGTQYKCSGNGPGSDVQVRKGYPTCTAAGACTADSPSWGSWSTDKMCNYNEVCSVPDPAKPGTCAPAPDCTPGTACCTAQGSYAAQATACGTSVVDTQFECTASLGGTIRKREAFAGCAGGSSWCSSSYPAWGDWSNVKICPALQACTPSWSDSYSPTCESQCNAGSTCCTAQGTFAAQATACGFGTIDSEQKCSGAEKGGKILERKASCGCLGTSTSCSCATANYAWSDWAATKTCLVSEVCEIAYGYASCVPYAKCSPSSTCCDADGQYASKTAPCGNTVADTQYQCASTALGADMQKRDAHYACTGTSTSCSYANADYIWGAWTTFKTCPSNQYCKLYADYMQPSCTATP